MPMAGESPRETIEKVRQAFKDRNEATRGRVTLIRTECGHSYPVHVYADDHERHTD